MNSYSRSELCFLFSLTHSKKTSDFPFICLGYKLPPGHSMALAVSIKDYGWYSIPLSGEDTGPFPFPIAGSFFDELYNDDLLMDDDKWVMLACYVYMQSGKFSLVQNACYLGREP